MPPVMKRVSKTAGLPPGTLVHVGEKRTEKVRVTLIDYDEAQFQECEVKTVEECFPFKETPTVTWINVDGIHQVDLIERIGTRFGAHPLILEDIVNTSQRPKVEDFGDYFFIVLKMLYYDARSGKIKSEQISLILGPTWVISFQERQGDVFDAIRERIRSDKGRIRKMGADYLAYSLVDAIIDNCFAILETVGERLEALEERLVRDPKPESLTAIHGLKREMILMRKALWPLREVVNGLQKGESSLIQKSTEIYLRDAYDHTIQVIDTIETFRDMISGMLDTYLSSLSNRMNEVMKVLTIIATIFIPLTFIAGIFGMNFKYMPELGWRWSYPVVWAVMLGVAGAMLYYFRKKKWI